MRRINLILLVVANTTLGHAQIDAEKNERRERRTLSVAGAWVGTLYQDPGGIATRYDFAMELTQDANQVQGFSVLQLPSDSAYGVMILIGEIHGDTLKFQETGLYEQRRPQGGRWCIKEGSLIYDLDRNLLSGPWRAPRCAPGVIELRSLADDMPGSRSILSLFIAKTPMFAATDQQQALWDRIYNGDYVWSLRFPEDEAMLLGYGLGLLNQLPEKCPDLLSQAELDEVRSFIPTLVEDSYGRLSLLEILQRASRIGVSYAGLRAAAGAHLDIRIKKDPTCSGAQIHRIGQNVWRMLAGRRPRYVGKAARRSTFVDQAVVLIDSRYHYYLVAPGPSLFGGVQNRVFESDVRQLRVAGVTILECRYDENPNDEYYEEQYYWGPSLAAEVFYPIQILWRAFIDSSQERMDRETGTARHGRGRVIHPFTTYGPPRRECPSLRDPELLMEQIPDRREHPSGSDEIVRLETALFPLIESESKRDVLMPGQVHPYCKRTLRDASEEYGPACAKIITFASSGVSYQNRDGSITPAKGEGEQNEIMRCVYALEEINETTGRGMRRFYMFWYGERTPDLASMTVNGREPFPYIVPVAVTECPANTKEVDKLLQSNR